nr:methyl-accepting chemotaxis protein [uncultured Stenotrophomonas sp.]
MKNLKIGARLGIGFAIVLSLLLVLTVTALARMQSAGDLTYRLVNTSIKNQRSMAEWGRVIELSAARLETAYVASDIATVKDIIQRMKDASGRSSQLQEEIEKGLRNEGVKAQLNVVKQERARYLEARAALFQAKLDGNAELATRVYHEQILPRNAAYQGAIAKMAKMQIEASDAVAASILDSYASTRTLMIVLGLAAIGLGIACAILITRSITVPIRQAVALAETVASGDLSSRIQAASRDETGQLMRALGAMNDSLAEIVGRVRSGTGAITVAAGEIAAGNHDLSARTEQQAGSLEETAASMEELTSTVKQNAENARQANTLAAQASSIAGQGGAMVAEVVATMGSIDASSRKIVDIISVIDGIAFQTNILALNAAVEAARAGEQGRSFAVVAAEVRLLAQRSAEAAKQIKGLIEDSVARAGQGNLQAGQAGATMGEIVGSVQQLADLLAGIRRASQDQHAGIAQVKQTIVQMEASTQRNASLVEEAGASTAQMQAQVHALAEAVGAFRLQSMPQARAAA